MTTILVLNSGSSSLKYQLISLSVTDVATSMSAGTSKHTGTNTMTDRGAITGTRLARGLIERIGTPEANISHTAGDKTHSETAPVLDFADAFRLMERACNATGLFFNKLKLAAVGHRVVQGGSKFVAPTVIDDKVLATIDELSSLAPLHNPGALAAIRAARDIFPVPHIAVFDTAFHQSLPETAYTYAIDSSLSREYHIRRYGFHGTSHQFVSRAAAEFLQAPLAELNQIVLHLGNGASACAVKGGKSVNTSMGLTPLEGLVMGSRAGDIDPSLIFYLHRVAGLSLAEIDTLLNKNSGLLGLCGSGDMRDVVLRASAGDSAAQLALEVYAARVRHYVGAYVTDLGRLDALVFTAGVGENSAPARQAICRGLEVLGVELDAELNNLPNTGARVISSAASQVKVLVVPTDEELEIARLVYKTLNK